MIINIDLELYPKLKNIENIENTINYLIQIGYNNVFIDNQNDIVNKIVYNLKNEILYQTIKLKLLMIKSINYLEFLLLLLKKEKFQKI